MFSRTWRRGSNQWSHLRRRGSLPSVEMLEDRMLLSATLVTDINQTTADAFPLFGPPAPAAVLNGVAYFVANDGANALWKSNGSAAGTVLVKDIADGGVTGNLTASNGMLYFSAFDSVHGNEPWVSDGTAAGTHLLLDINPGRGPTLFGGDPLVSGLPNSSDPSQFTSVGKLTFFTANDGVHGQEVWVTDGKAADTHMVRDINPGNNGPLSNGEAPGELTAYKGRLYFMADDGVHGVELWTSDGSAAGTHLVKDIHPGPAGSAPAFFPFPFAPPQTPRMVVSGGLLFFAADDGVHGVELWASDGSTGGTHLVKDINPGSTSGILLPPPPGFPPVPVTANSSNPSWLTDVNGKLYFTADDGVHGVEVWTSDGSVGGTRLAAEVPARTDIFGNPVSGYPQDLTVSGGELYFLATNATFGQSLWVLNPATNATTRLLDLTTPPNPLFPQPPIVPGSSAPLMAAGGKVYFVNYDAAHGRELWVTDGTVRGTRLVEDIRPGAASSHIGFLTALNGKALFAADDGTHGRELWTSDGSAAGTHLVKDINAHTNSAAPSELTRIGNIVYFSADDGLHGRQLWRTDGTAAGTWMVKAINPNGVVPSPSVPGETDPASANVQDLVVLDGLLYFSAGDGVHGQELWRSDGTAAGTRMVKDVNPGPAGSNIGDLTVMGHRLFFAADDGVHGRELWVSDGTAAGTHLVKDINAQPPPILLPPFPVVGVPGANQGSNPSDLTVLNGNLYFVADDGVHGRELWRTDGSAGGTHTVVNLSPGVNPNPSQLTRVGNVIYFTTSDGIHGQGLWKTDGTARGTVLVREFKAGSPSPVLPFPNSTGPTNLTAAGNTLYFTADDGTHGVSLYKADAAGVHLLKSFHPEGTPGFAAPPMNLKLVGNTLFFTADDGIHGDELWKSDGSSGGTVMVKDISPGTGPFGPNSSGPASLTAINGLLYFTADDGVHGREVWRSDGTAKGTLMVQDVNPGPASGADWTFQAVGLGSSVLFTANDGTHGVELWRTSARS